MKEDIEKAVRVLKAGGTILYPTDTLWGIGCDATNQKALQKINTIKRRKKKDGYIILLEDEQKIGDYVEQLPAILWDLLKNIDSPTTIIYPGGKNVAKGILAPDGSIAIRVVKKGFCSQMLAAFGKPVLSTSANFSGQPSPILFKDVPEEIRSNVDYAVGVQRDQFIKVKASTIIRITDQGEFEIIRQ
ncbi:MAG: threonylcarbamoyl-AMP synthase [Bacteroidales bacterium]|nr:threonylcarbamoyl-AMP synthase [Bacteroidales bacterium]